MGKRFVSKRRKKYSFRKCFILFLIGFIASFLFYGSQYIKVTSSNESLFKWALKESGPYITQDGSSILQAVFNFVSDIDMKEPVHMLMQQFKMMQDEVYNDDYSNFEELSKVTNHVVDPKPVKSKDPIVYLYNSHQLETYAKDPALNIAPNVMMASYALRDRLEKLGISTLVEESDITDFMKVNQYLHKDSYKASRYYIQASLKQNPTLTYFIDLHRDAIGRKSSVTTIQNKECAKVLFVVGMEHDQYQKNLALANLVHSKIKAKYPTLSRGVITKKGANVDGIYNQDLSPNMLLIELGGYENTMEEVNHTLDLLVPILKEVIAS